MCLNLKNARNFHNFYVIQWKKMRLSNLRDMKELSKKVIAQIHSDSIILLKGELGVGKTTLASYILQSIVNTHENFTSPTFNIVHEYHTNNNVVFHLDLYRIKNINELYEIGFESMIQNNIMIIEWPEIALPILKKFQSNRIIMIKLSFESSDVRVANIITPCRID